MTGCWEAIKAIAAGNFIADLNRGLSTRFDDEVRWQRGGCVSSASCCGVLSIETRMYGTDVALFSLRPRLRNPYLGCEPPES